MSDWRIAEVAGLRIVSDELWNAVRSRQDWLVRNFTKGSALGLLSRHASSRFLFSGLLYCSECGGRLTVICGHGKKNHRRYGCSQNFNRGTCANTLRERQDRIESRLLEGLQAKVLHPEAIEYAFERFQHELNSVLRAETGQLEQLRERREQLTGELRNLAATAARTGPSEFLIEEIVRRERELQDVIERIASDRIDSTQDTTDNLRAFVRARLSNVRQVLNADVEKARGEIARHVSRIEMKPVRSPGERGHYVAIGNWNLLGTALERDRAPHLEGGGARMVAGVRFELTTFGL